LKPIKITAHMLDGRVATTDLCLPIDSMLAWAWIAKHHPEKLEHDSTRTRGVELIDPDLPLERREANGEWYWAASFALGEPMHEFRNFWHKRFDAQEAEDYADFQGRRGKVNVGAAQYKNYRMPLTIFLVPELTWYVVGDEDKLTPLLWQITSIGKKRSQGYGKIREWEIEDADEDLSHLRAIPDPGGDAIYGVRPPYWLGSNVMRVAIPADKRLATNAI
jgi:CRISPR type IV-associated protein Csf3